MFEPKYGAVLIVCCLIGLSFIVDRSNAKDIGNGKQCVSKECVQYANMVLHNMNQSVDPCESFYEFSCGNYVKTTKISDDRSSASAFYDLDEKLKSDLSHVLAANIDMAQDNSWTINAKKFYASCINIDAVNRNTEPLLWQIINEDLGGWPMLNGNTNNLTILELMIRLNQFTIQEFPSVSVSTSPKNSSVYALRVGQPGRMPAEIYDFPDFYTAYMHYFKTALAYFNPTSSVPVKDKDINDIFQLEKTLAQAQMTISQQKNSSINVKMTVKDLANKVPNFPWKSYVIDGMFRGVDNVKVNENEPIFVNDMDYLKRMADIYTDYSTNKPSILANYLLANFFSSVVSYLPIKYMEARHPLDRLLDGKNALPPRDKFCVDLTIVHLPMEVGRIYTANFFDKTAKSNALEMTNNILSMFKQMLKENTWMDAESKKNSIEKANFIKTKIGYPDYYDNNTYIATHFIYNLELDNLLINKLIVDDYSNRVMSFGRLRDLVDKNEWFSTPAIVNAFYEPLNNQIYFPAGILQTPFFNPKLPRYINYGAIGAVIGHEITHGFDDSGRTYDKYGNYFSDKEQGLLTDTSVANFKKKTQCMIDQYSSYEVPQLNRKLNGYQTLGENIADNGGLKAAFRTYQKWETKNPTEPKLPGLDYTPEQMFFISLSQIWCSKYKNERLLSLVLSDVHSPPDLRVKGMTANSEYFKKAFNCKKNTGKECSIW